MSVQNIGSHQTPADSQLDFGRRDSIIERDAVALYASVTIQKAPRHVDPPSESTWVQAFS